jgi:hypothetical protein
VTAYMNDLRATGATSGSAMTRVAQMTRIRDPTRECNDCVVSTSSSSDPEPVPHHCATDAQRRACLDKLAEARHQLEDELANLHRELGEDHEPPIGNLPRCRPFSWSRCRNNVVKRTANGRSVVLLLNNFELAPRHCRLGDVRVTMIDAPTKAQTSTPTLTVTPHRSLGGHCRTWPLQPCCSAAARRQRPPKRDECANSLRRCSKQR